MIKEYKKDDIIILWQPTLCIHCGDCVRGLSSVFKPKERPWIQTENAIKEEIIKQVNACPSKALSIKE